MSWDGCPANSFTGLHVPTKDDPTRCQRCGARQPAAPRQGEPRRGHEPAHPIIPLRTGTLEEQFWRFHEQHPEVYDELAALCRQWRVRNRRAWSINGAFEVLRWQRRLEGLPDDSEAFKLNNNYRSRYARLLMEREADLDGIFEVREMTSATEIA